MSDYGSDIKYMLDTLKTNDNRLANFYLNYFSNIDLFEKTGSRSDIYNFHPNNDDLKYIQNKLKNTIDRLNPTEDDLDEAIRLGTINILPIESFTWLKDDYYACAYFWGVLRKREDEVFHETPEESFGIKIKRTRNNNWYNFLDLSIYPMSHDEMYQVILNIFDGMFCRDNGDKQLALDSLKKLWLKASKDIHTFSFIDENNDKHVDWLLDYLNKYRSEKTSHRSTKDIVDNFILKNKDSLQDYFSLYPQNCRKGKLIAIYSTLRLWDSNDHFYERKNFIQNLKLAWKQWNARKNMENTVSISSVIGKKEKERLKEMAKHYRINQNALLESIINKQYEKYQKDPDNF